MSTTCAPFVLGTVQLGLPYGIANVAGKPDREQAFAILSAAVTAGVSTLDTAHAYGTSEDVIGDWLRSTGGRIDIVTKSPDLDGAGVERAEAALEAGCDVVLQCSGSLADMAETASGCGALEGISLVRARAVEAFAKRPADEFDAAAGWARYKALMSGFLAP